MTSILSFQNVQWKQNLLGISTSNQSGEKRVESFDWFEIHKNYLRLQTSTSGVILTFFLRGTTSPSSDFIAMMCWQLSSKSTLWIPAKSFFKCVWMTFGFVDCPSISSKSSSPMK